MRSSFVRWLNLWSLESERWSHDCQVAGNATTASAGLSARPHSGHGFRETEGVDGLTRGWQQGVCRAGASVCV